MANEHSNGILAKDLAIVFWDIMVTEIELKYSLLESHDLTTTASVETIIEELLTEQNISFTYQEKYLTNCYFDTESLSLRQQKIALRTRGTKCSGEQTRFEQTIKTSGKVIAGLHQRPEYNVDIDNSSPAISLFPESIWQAKTDIVKLQHQLIELFSTNFTRHTFLLSFDNAQVELVVDSGEICCKGLNETDKIYEIELELVSGGVEKLFSVVKLLFTKLSLRPGQLTKAARGYALYKKVGEKTLPVHDLKSSKAKVNTVHGQSELAAGFTSSMITLSKQSQIHEAFEQGLELTLAKLQRAIDDYVAKPSLLILKKISEFLAFVRQGLWLFADNLPPESLKLRAELSYFIRTIHWVEVADHIQIFLNKQSQYQKEILVSQALIAKLQLSQNRYPDESQVLALFHSERFNNLQLDLLILLLKSSNESINAGNDGRELLIFASEKLNTSHIDLKNQLANLHQPELYSAKEVYLNTNSLLIRALLTTSWFNSLFSDVKAVSKYETPRLDIKQGISELHFLNLLEQQLMQLPQPAEKLENWLINKSENLIAALDQSCAKALSMKPYWL